MFTQQHAPLHELAGVPSYAGMQCAQPFASGSLYCPSAAGMATAAARAAIMPPAPHAGDWSPGAERQAMPHRMSLQECVLHADTYQDSALCPRDRLCSAACAASR